MNKIIEDLNWRYATKKFDLTKKITPENIEIIKESLRLVPSSYGLQPLKYLFIEDSVLRQQLREKSFNQSQITDASHLLVICSLTEITEDFIDNYIQNISQIRSVPINSISGFSNYMKKEILSMQKDKMAEWNAKQAYIALGHLLHTCASLRIDATPMEGFQKEAYDEVLNLKQQGLQSVLVCPIGYRSEEDSNQFLKKVRRSKESLFELIQ
ncbi:MAG: NAD(P)H-dependent oxidoreductase [Bacteroidetes bacterium]|nr:NAD(P)H-dependent oxidoreductase [Bacteroidota bacterium]